MTLATDLSALSACPESIRWVRRTKLTPAKMWAQCPRGDWMLWLAGAVGVDRKAIVMAACACARLALPHARDPRVLTCIETTEAWCRGEATIEQVREARLGAWAAASADAVAVAADAAAYAAAAAYADAAYADAAYAYAAAYADAAYAVVAYAARAARARTLRACAAEVRKHITAKMVRNAWAAKKRERRVAA